MKCPKCKTGELNLYKVTEKVYHFNLTKNNKIYKRPDKTDEFDTEKDYLESKNMDCNQYYYYELDSKGRIIKESLSER